MNWYWKPHEVPVHRGWDITTDAFTGKKRISDGRYSFGPFDTEDEARRAIDTRAALASVPSLDTVL